MSKRLWVVLIWKQLLKVASKLRPYLNNIPLHTNLGSQLSLESSKVWYDGLLVRFEALKDGNLSIDNKLSVLATVAVTLLVFELALPGASTAHNLNVLGIVGSVLLIASAVVAFYSAKLKDALPPVVTPTEQPGYYTHDDHTFMWQMIRDLEHAIGKAAEANTWKAKRYKVAFVLFSIASLLIVLSQFVDIRFIIK